MESEEVEFEDLVVAQTAPIEVLSVIFEHLNLYDRLVTRQVCRRWYEACNDKMFQMREKLSVAKLYMGHLDSVLDFLMNVNRSYLNLKFTGIDFENYSLNFWLVCGPKIYSLELIECEVSLETFSYIIKYCSRLQSFTLKLWNGNFIGDNYAVREYRTKSINLEVLVEEGYVNEAVQCVEFHFRGFRHEWPSWLVQLLKLFPRMKRFGFYGGDFSLFNEIMSINHLEFINQAFSNGQIEELKLVVYQYGYRELDWKVLATKLQLTSLIEVVVHLTDNTDRNMLTNFLKSQHNLQILHFLLRTTGDNVLLNEAIEIIFATCKKLQDFRITSFYRILWGSTWFQLLAKSSIEKLSIECDNITFPNLKEYPPNSTMQNLHIHFKSYFNTSTIPLMEAFEALKDLTLFKITDKIMQVILDKQPQLKVLNARFKARLLSNPSESHLPHLDLSVLHVEKLEIPADLPKNPNFLVPTLKYLHLNPPMGEVFYNPISLNTSLSPLLEEVVIDSSCFTYPFVGSFLENIVNFINPLKRLRYLFLSSRTRSVYSNDMPYLTNEDVISIFKSCASLRCFVYKRIYFCNIFEPHFVTIDMSDKFIKTLPNLAFQEIPPSCLTR